MADPKCRAPLRLFAFFHLNLAFSSISEGDRTEVITRCYQPLLNLAETCGPLGIEATGFTLEEIYKRDPAWIERLKQLITAGKVCFIGSGYAQIIGPLVPARVTEENLRQGHTVYEKYLGMRPTIALVNEQAYSGGVADLYLDAGYDSLLMDWDNPASFHDWPEEMRFAPARARTATGRDIGLIWTDTVLFQMLQRFAHGDIPLEEYLSFIRKQKAGTERTLCIYASDGEIFDYRPGRYRSEEVFSEDKGSEWQHLENAFTALQNDPENNWLSPEAISLATTGATPLRLETPECPVPVKKQRKYNLSRWAVTGRDDTALNAACEQIYQAMCECDPSAEDWRALLRLWASDLRTHITDARWTAAKAELAGMQARFPAQLPAFPHPRGTKLETRYFDMATERVSARLDRRRGLSLDQIRFDNGPALAGKLPLGVFSDIGWQADWYTGDSVFDAPGEHKVTDLEWGEAMSWQMHADCFAATRIPTPRGDIEKLIRFSATEPRIDFDVQFHWDSWGKGCLRLGLITLLPEAFDAEKLVLTTHNGGKTAESFALGGHTVEHGQPVSFLVSASQGLGMTEGWASLSDGRHYLKIDVDRCCAPLLGLLTYRRLRGGLFCQFALSALELDDTRKPDALHKGPRRFRFSLEGGSLSATC